MLDYGAELALERARLVKAERHVQEGEERVRAHLTREGDVRARGLMEAGQPEWLLTLLRETLSEWSRHRDLIRERVPHLEACVRRRR